MTTDPSDPTPPSLARPFSRPTHPSIPAIGTEGAVRPARPTPYAAAAIRPREEHDASATASAEPETERGKEPADDTAVGGGALAGASGAPAVAVELRRAGAGGAGSGRTAEPGGRARAGGQRLGLSRRRSRLAGRRVRLGRGGSDDVEPAGSRFPARPRADSATVSDLAAGAAQLLEGVARSIRHGQLVLPAMSWPQTAPAVLAGVLTALLARESGRPVSAAANAPAGERPSGGRAFSGPDAGAADR